MSDDRDKSADTRVECPMCFGKARVADDGSLRRHAIPFGWDYNTIPTSALCLNTQPPLGGQETP